jgi:hypothetical protein
VELSILKPTKVYAGIVKVVAKVCDRGSYELCANDGTVLASRDDDYVPSFFPGEHYGDYIMLDIDIDTGVIINWKKPSTEQVVKEFRLGGDE